MEEDTAAPIPEEYCRQCHAKTNEKHMWLTSHGYRIAWRNRIVRFWMTINPPQ